MKKSKTRIYVNQSLSSNLMIYIKNRQHHFLKNVLRVKLNDHVNIFNENDGEWESIIISINRENIVLRISKKIRDTKKNLDLWLAFAPIKQHRMSIAIQKATELGVSRIIPCITEYTNMRKVNIKNLLDNAIEAAEQSDRIDIPKIDKQVDLKSLLMNWPKERKIIYCDEKLDTKKSLIKTLIELENIDMKIGVLIGPEGGFSDIEKDLITQNDNTISVSLGERLLRSDTAIAVSLFCIQDLLSLSK